MARVVEENAAPMEPPLPPQIKQLSMREEWLKGIIFGDSGVGKTRLCSTAPGPILWLSMEFGLKVLSPQQRERDVIWEDEPGAGITSWDELMGALEWLEAGGDKRFPTVVMDTGTEAGKLLRKEILGGTSPMGRVHPLAFSRTDYDVFAERYLEMIRRFRSLHCNVIFNMQTQDLVIEEAEASTLIRLPNLGAGQKGPKEITALLDFVIYLGVVQDKNRLVRRALFQPVGNRRAKVRIAGGKDGPIDIPDPDMAKIFTLMKTGEYPA